MAGGRRGAVTVATASRLWAKGRGGEERSPEWSGKGPSGVWGHCRPLAMRPLAGTAAACAFAAASGTGGRGCRVRKRVANRTEQDKGGRCRWRTEALGHGDAGRLSGAAEPVDRLCWGAGWGDRREGTAGEPTLPTAASRPAQ